MSKKFLVFGVFILILVVGVGVVSGLSQDPKISVDKSVKSDGLHLNITGKSVSRIEFTVPKGWESTDHIDDGGRYSRNKYINRDINGESLDVSWVWVNNQPKVEVSTMLVPTNKADTKSIDVKAMNFEDASTKTIEINSFEVQKEDNNSIRNNSKDFGKTIKKIVNGEDMDISNIAGLDIVNDFIEMAKGFIEGLSS